MSFLLEGTIKNYEWGKLRNNSLINNFITLNNIKTYNEEEYLAEIWFGTHKLGISKIIDNNISINSIISKYMNTEYTNIYNDQIPFIFKILSIMKPLSIQVHPEKKKAEELHKKNPDIYLDPNQKSEMVLALSNDFELLYGFDNYENIKNKFTNFPLLLTYLENIIPSFNEILDLTDTKLHILINIIKKEIEYSKNIQFIELIKYLISNFDYDRGILIAFYMKHICLQKGESIFIKANTLHCYLKGDIIEIMNKSDNVIRLGLTKKYKDYNAIRQIFNKHIYNETHEFYIKPILNKYFIQYIPPLINFQLICPRILTNELTLKLPNIYPLIALIIDGNCYLKNLQKYIKKGMALLILDEEEITHFSTDLYLVCATMNINKIN
jgi:mannose-6-phosphate isomerase